MLHLGKKLKLRKKDRYIQNTHWGWKLNGHALRIFSTLWFLFQNKLYGDSKMKILFSINDFIPAFEYTAFSEVENC